VPRHLAASLGLGLLLITMGGVSCDSVDQTGDLSKAPHVLPNWVGETREMASQELDDLGIAFHVVAKAPPEDDLVFGQSPSPGVALANVDHVELRVHCQPAPCPSPPEGEAIYDPCSCASR
jgi:hypothetical protein